MKNKEDKHIEILVENLMKEISQESPSIDFTAKVMSEVLASKKSKTFVYKPIISKPLWFIIFGSILALFAFLIFNTQTTSAGINFNFNFLSLDKLFETLAGFQISSMTTNVVIMATLMLLIQFFLLKNYLDKRIQK